MLFGFNTIRREMNGMLFFFYNIEYLCNVISTAWLDATMQFASVHGNNKSFGNCGSLVWKINDRFPGLPHYFSFWMNEMVSSRNRWYAGSLSSTI